MKDLKVWCEVVCDSCCSTMEGRFYHQGTISRLREEAAKAGWKVLDSKTLCPDCVKKKKALNTV